MWIYFEVNSECYHVGYYDPRGMFHTVSEYKSRWEAEAKVHYLNGGN